MDQYNRVYVKIFKINNSEGIFTKEDFNLFKEKLELIRILNYNPKINRDDYDDLKDIINEVKRAAWAAKLNASLSKLSLHSNYSESRTKYGKDTTKEEIISIDVSASRRVEYNVIVYFKRYKAKDGDDKYIITKLDSFSNNIVYTPGVKTRIFVGEKAQNMEDIVYEYIWSE